MKRVAMNKKGKGGWIPFVVLGAVLIIVLLATGVFSGFEFNYNFDSLTSEISDTVSFGDAWDTQSFFFLDYIFGQIPAVLVEGTNAISASIIIIGVWFLFFLIFGDIISLFGSFSKQVSWIIAGVLTVIVSNLSVVMLFTVAALGITAVFGALSVVASIALIFGLFLVFHFSFGAWGSRVRRGIIMRRAEDSALRTTAGGKKLAATVEALNETGEALGK